MTLQILLQGTSVMTSYTWDILGSDLVLTTGYIDLDLNILLYSSRQILRLSQLDCDHSLCINIPID